MGISEGHNESAAGTYRTRSGKKRLFARITNMLSVLTRSEMLSDKSIGIPHKRAATKLIFNNYREPKYESHS